MPPDAKTESLGGALVSRNLLEGRGRLRWAFREAGANPADTGWRFLSAIDDDDYINDPANLQVVDYSTVIGLEPSLEKLYGLPVGAEFEFDVTPDGALRMVDSRLG